MCLHSVSGEQPGSGDCGGCETCCLQVRWDLDLSGIHWLIAGGESGPSSRPMHELWVRDLRDQCAAAGVPFFFKQWGGRTPKANGRELDGTHHDAMPAALARA